MDVYLYAKVICLDSINILALPHAHPIRVSEESTKVFFSSNQYIMQKNIITHHCTLGSILGICIVNFFQKTAFKESLLFFYKYLNTFEKANQYVYAVKKSA